MSQSMLSQSPNALQQQAIEAFVQTHYAQAAWCYEQLMELEPEQLSHAWYLGLARLLSGQEAEAQLTWMMALSAAEPDQVDSWTEQLVKILQTEADRQAEAEAWQLVWAIRQHIHQIAPLEINNLLHLVQLAIKLNLFNSEYLETLKLVKLLQSPSADLDQTLLLTAVADAIDCQVEDAQVKELTEASLAQIHDSKLILSIFAPRAYDAGERSDHHLFEVAVYFAEICLRYAPDDIELLKLLSASYEKLGRHVEAVEVARRYLTACETLEDRMAATGYLCVRLLRTGLCWDEVRNLFEQQKVLMDQIVADYKPDPNRPIEPSLLTFCSFYLNYLSDNPAEHRRAQNQLAKLLQTDLRFQVKPTFEACQKRLTSPAIKTKHKLKIAYMARCMQQHPVGWLARWLMQYHDKDQFEIYTYHLHMSTVSDFTDRWFVKPVTRSARFDKGTWAGISKHICENDEIDILVDLDSITYTESCNILALKPAPIQVSWLGFDASGIPAVDYFIADPYVLPESAQDYYSEKIWRLPSTYLAVDGFEVGPPTLRRDQLGIPTDAVIYLTAQDGRKRHPEMMRLQLRILREVPNSYLLVKGLGDASSLQTAFELAAESEGVGRDRLRFLGRDLGEPTHRANLGIADIVLDTYPYNGATTTLETLWMGIPIITRVGQQWAARNSYTMLMNVGVSEGIAWTDEEYLEWGVRLGNDAALRQTIRTKLLQSRQTSPLWNSKQFAREMEAAYQQMWQIYLDTH